MANNPLIQYVSTLNPDGTPNSGLVQVARAPEPSPQPFLKALEGNGFFQRVRQTQADVPLTGADLLFTFCGVTDYGTRPFGNLFPSLRLPVTPAERQARSQFYAGTALAGFENLESVVVAEVPANRYGEMLDGKSISLRLPIVLPGQPATTYTLFGNYFGFNTNLNNQFSDTNPFSGLLGAEPTAENDYNSNIAYLFCNEIQSPLDAVTPVVLQSGTLTVPARGSASFTLPLTAGLKYRLGVSGTGASLRVRAQVPGLGLVDLLDVVEGGVLNPDNSFQLRQAVSQLFFYNDTYAAVVADQSVTRLDVASTRAWAAWTPLNRYPVTPNSTGIPVADFFDPQGSGVYDAPVGFVALDKGLIVLTHPFLVRGLRRDAASGATCVSPTDNTTLIPVAATGPYTRLRYVGDNGTLAQLSYRSVVTELVQTFTAMAGINEFTKTTNPTYDLAYPDGSGGGPPVVTEVGLYNRTGELIAVAKTSEPIIKQPGRPILYAISLRV